MGNFLKLSILLVLILVNTPSFAVKFNFTQSERAIIKQLSDNCLNTQLPQSLFPDIYLNSNLAISCEVSSFFGKSDADRRLAQYFFARYVDGKGTQYEDFNFIWTTKAQIPGLSSESKNTLQNLSSRNQIYDLNNPNVYSAILELATLGDASSIYAIYLNQYSEKPRVLQTQELENFESYLGSGLANLLFLKPAQLLEKYPHKEDVEELLDEIITNSATTGKVYLKDAVHKFLSLVDSHQEYDDLIPIQLLKSSSNFRQNIIRARLLTNHVSEDYFRSALLIELNDAEKNSLFTIGLDKNGSDLTNADEISELIGCLERFEEAALGLITISTMWGDALCIQDFQYRYNDIESLFKSHYPNVPFEQIKNSNFQEYEAWLISGEKGNELFKLLAFGDFRHFSNRPIPVTDGELYKAHRIAREKYGLDNFTKPYNGTQIFGEFAKNSRSMDIEKIYEFLKKRKFSVEILCEDISSRMCAKIARSVNLDSLATKNLKVDITKLTGKRCEINQKSQKIIQFFTYFNHTNRRILSECSKEDLIAILGFPKNQFLQKIIKFSGLPNLNTELQIIQNPQLYQNNFFSQISAHYNSATNSTEMLKLPHQGLDYHSSLQKHLHLVDNAVLATNPIGQIEIEKIDFGKNSSLLENTNYKPLFAIAKSYENLSSYESAFLTYHLSFLRELHSEFGEPNELISMNILTSAITSAKNAGIPDKFIREYVFNAIEAMRNSNRLTTVEQGFKEAQSDGISFSQRAMDGIIDANNILYQYARGTSNQELSIFNGDYAPRNYAKNYGKLLSATPLQMKNICKDYRTSENIEKFLNSKIGNEFFDTKMVSIAMVTESLMFLTKCRNISGWLQDISLKDLNKEYKQLLIDTNKYMQQGVNPYSIKYLPLYETLADMSSRNLKPLGAVLALTINKYIAEEMSNAFVMRDSSLLRLSQASMERIWSSLFNYGQDAELEEKYGKKFSYRFNYNLNAQSLNFHFPMTTSKTRNRFATGHGDKNFIGFDYFDKKFQKLKGHLESQNKLISEAKTPLEYLTFRAKKSNHSNDLDVDVFNIARTFENFLYLDESNEILKNKVIVNLLYGNGRVVIQTSSNTSKFAVGGVNIDDKKVSELKQRIISKNDFVDNDLNLGCEIFKPLHKFLEETIKQNNKLKFIIAVPSVNLLPIPSEVILGSYCTSNKWSIIHAGDILAAVEFSANTEDWIMPKKFIGVGNPTSNDRGIKLTVNLGTTFRSGLKNEDVTLDLQSLPPLIDAVKEIETVSNEFREPINLLGTEASIEDALLYAQKISTEEKTFLLLATHGIKPDYDKDISIPSLLSVKNGELNLIETNLIDTFKLDDTVVLLSACDTAGGFLDRTDLYFTGFASSFANAGAKLILSSLWPVYSDVSRETSENFIKSWQVSDIETAITNSKSSLDYSVKTLPFVFLYP